VKIIDFTDCQTVFNSYRGSEAKLALIYQNEKYMVKFPDPIRQKGREISYINNAFSEYIGCRIYESIGITAQETLLGIYKQSNGKEKYVCACKDFTSEDKKLYEFETIQLSNVELEKKPTSELTDIMNDIEACKLIKDKEKIKAAFWEMFIVDAFIGNPDRHTANWGLLVSEKSDQVEFAPIYDCGSSLCPLYMDEDMRRKLNNPVEFNNIVQNVYSAIRVEGKRINYTGFISSLENKNCNEALLRVFPKIDMDKAYEIINAIEIVSPARKEFYTEFLKARYENILQRAYKKVIKQEMAKDSRKEIMVKNGPKRIR